VRLIMCIIWIYLWFNFLGLIKMNIIRLCNHGQHLKNNQLLNEISSSYNLIFPFELILYLLRCVPMFVHDWCDVHLSFTKCIECIITLFRQRAAHGSWLYYRRSSWATTWWRQVSSDLSCPIYFIIHCIAVHYWKLKDWLVYIYLSLLTFWVIMVSFMLFLYFNINMMWILWYDDVISMMFLWYFRGLRLFPEYLSVRTCLGSDNPG
jgi:hypothetical protein